VVAGGLERRVGHRVHGVRADQLVDVREAGVDFDQIVATQLVEEGVASFAKSFDSMLETIEEKASKVTAG